MLPELPIDPPEKYAIYECAHCGDMIEDDKLAHVKRADGYSCEICPTCGSSDIKIVEEGIVGEKQSGGFYDRSEG